jgi:septal ring factor EnvC (AmiA/AmiB activator)
VTEMIAFFQSHSGAIAIFISLASAVIATRFVTKLEFKEAIASQRADHEKAISSLDAKFTLSIEKVDKAEDRIAKLENEFRHLPDRDSVHRIELSLSAVKGELKALGEQLKPVAAISDRLQEFLLEQAKR